MGEELFKYWRQSLNVRHLNFINKYWKIYEVFKPWCKVKAVSIFKEGDKNKYEMEIIEINPNECKLISLLYIINYIQGF